MNPLAAYLLWFGSVSGAIQEQIAMFVIASAPHGVFDYRAGDRPADVFRSHIQRATAELRFSAALYRMTVAGLALTLGTLTEAAFRARPSPQRKELMEHDRAEIETAFGREGASLLIEHDASTWTREYTAWKRFRRKEFSEDAIASWGSC